jgi:Tol biopolymer transport system component
MTLMEDHDLEIYAVDIDGKTVTNLTNNPAVDAYPAWVP